MSRKYPSKIQMKKYQFFFLTCFSLIVSLSGILNPATGFAQNLTEVRLQLKWKHQFQFAGYYAAIEQGYYRDAGLHVLLQEAKEGENPSDAVFSGLADFGVCTSEILLKKAEGKSPVLLATIFQHSPLVLVASAKAEINHVQDLAGKKLALEPNSADIIAYLNDEGVSLTQCKLFEHEFNVNNLLSGEVDAISAYLTDEPFLLKEAGFDFYLIKPVMGGIDFYGDGLFTTREFLEKNRDLVGRFREASLKGWAYAMANPEEIAKLIYTTYSQRHSLDHLVYEADRMKKLIMNDVVEIGYTNPGRMESIVGTYQKVGMLNPDFSLEGVLYSDYLETDTPVNWRVLGPLILILIAVVLTAAFFYRLSRNLKKEISSRIAAESELRKSESRLRTLSLAINQSPVTILITDMAGNIEFVNPWFTETTGYRYEEVAGKNPRFLKPGTEYGLNFKEMWDTILSGKSWTGVYQNRKKNGDLFWESAIISPVKDKSGEITHFLAVKEDITQKKEREEEIRRKNEELSRLNAEKDKFFSIISHDLRNPFNGFLGLTNLLLDEFSALSESEIKQYITDLNQSAGTLYLLLEDLLAWARIQQGLMPFSPVPLELKPVAGKSLAILSETARLKKVTVENSIPDGLIASADQNMLQAVFSNLITNAVKFTPQSGKVTLSAETWENEVTVSVKDTGIGMSEKVSSGLFSLSGTAGRTGTDGEPGTGLGLILCREFIEKHNGKIWVESREGHGSNFKFTLPVRPVSS